MTKQEFLNHVLEVLNDAVTGMGDVELIGSDLAKVPLYAEKLYPAAWRRAVKILPRSWFETKSFAGQPKHVDAPDGTGYVVLPGDYLVLSYFKMKGWKTGCLVAPDETPDINAKQQNEYLRGTPRRPVCVLRFVSYNSKRDAAPELKRALYYYSLPRSADESTHVIEQALYIPNITAMPEALEFNDNLYEPLAYICASTVLTSQEKTEAAKAIDTKVLEML